MKSWYLKLLIISLGLGLLSFIYYKYSYHTKIVHNISSLYAWKDSLTMTHALDVKLSLDSLTAPESVIYYQFIPGEGKTGSLTFLNTASNAIYFYDLSTGGCKKIIHLNEYGFSKKDKLQGYHILSDDSLLVYSYSSSKISFLSLTKGILFSKTLNDRESISNINFYPYVSARTPILYNQYKKEFYLSGFLSDEGGGYEFDKERKVLFQGNFSTGQFGSKVNYPTFYWGENWGGAGGYRQSFADINDNQDIVISFMADHNVWIYNPKTGVVKKKYSGSKFFKDIQSLNVRPFYYRFMDEYDIYKYYLINPSYSCVIYDQYNKLYYRVAELPLKYVGDFSKQLHKPKSIIILNKNLNKVGEVLITDQSLDLNEYFTTKDGLYIKKRSTNDDYLTFEKFIIKPHY